MPTDLPLFGVKDGYYPNFFDAKDFISVISFLGALHISRNSKIVNTLNVGRLKVFIWKQKLRNISLPSWLLSLSFKAIP